jgi:hypothetical protein
MNAEGSTTPTDAGERIAVTKASEPVSADPAPAIPQAASQEQKQSEPGWLKRAWRKTSLTDWLIVGLYGGLLWIAIRQADLTTNANNVAVTSANAATVAAEAAKETAKLTVASNATSERCRRNARIGY